MSTFPKSDPLSIQCEYSKLNTEEGESPQLSDEDESNDETLLKI